MPKKSKTGKSRKDEYYHMAKNTGLRARSSFKLIEINKLFHILEKATILIDLCAAPGGWMQIAAKTMKMSSFIIGVDLVPIKPIPGCISIQADITTDYCKQQIRKHILKAKADVILHDGAPNVGSNWNVDEFQQAHLCLKAFALATEFLVKNGTFVTKVFRSKDYEPLKWVFDQLFEQVKVVKPKSSRAESAEIFLVCLKYKAPTTIDPKFLDIQHVFEDVDENEETELTFNKVARIKKKALGYDENDTLYKEVKVSELLASKLPMNTLLTANKVIIDDEAVRDHPMTTDVIKQYLVDLKLLGKYDFKALEKWLRKVVPFYQKLHNLLPVKPVVEEVPVVEKTEEDKIQEAIDKCEDELRKTEKKKLRKVRLEKMKQIKRIQLSMLHPDDVIEQDYDADLFSASKNQDLIESGMIPIDMDVADLDKVIIPEDVKRRKDKLVVRPTKETFTKSSDKYYDTDDNLTRLEDSDRDSSDEDEKSEDSVYEIESGGEDYDDENEIDDEDMEFDEEEEEDEGSEDEQQVDLDEESGSEVSDNDEESIEDIGDEDDEAMEIDQEESDDDEESTRPKKSKSAGISDLNFDPTATTPRAKKMKMLNSWFEKSEFTKLMNDVDEDEDSDMSDEEVIEDISDEKNPVVVKIKKPTETDTETKLDVNNSDHLQILNTLKRKLTPKERALAVEMIKSKKSRREILEWGYNRYQFDDENLPAWFVADEKKHMCARLPFVDKKAIDAQKAAVSTNINKRTIKKVEQAKDRKKRHMMRKLTRLNKKASHMDDDLMEVEKRKKLQDLSKKVHRLKNTKKPVVTEVTNRSGQRSRVGAYKKGAKLKIVDKRMKKDSRGKSATNGKDKKKRGRK